MVQSFSAAVPQQTGGELPGNNRVLPANSAVFDGGSVIRRGSGSSGVTHPLSVGDWAEQTAAEMPGNNQLSYVLGAISNYVQCHTVLLNSVGEVLGSIGPAPLQLLCNFLFEHPGETAGTVGSWQLRVHEHKTVNLSYVLVFAAKTPPQISPDFLHSAELLLSAALGMASHADSLVADEGRQLLQLLEQGISAGQESRYWLRLAEFGFNRESGLRLLTLEQLTGQAAAQTPRDIRKLLLRCANGNGAGTGYLGSEFIGNTAGSRSADGTIGERIPVSGGSTIGGESVHSSVSAHGSGTARGGSFVGGSFVGERCPLIVGVAMPAGKSTATVHALTSDNKTVIERLIAAIPGVACGISASHSSLTHLPFAVTEAETALEIAQERGAALADPPTHSVVGYSELELVEWLRSQVSRHAYLARVSDFTAELRANPEYLETVIAYLANDMNTNRTAQALHIHPNTVRYRLDRAAESLGTNSLSSPFLLAGLVTSFAPEIYAARNPDS